MSLTKHICLPHNPSRADAVIVGIPKEIKRDEYRVAILPVGVEEMVRAGHHVLDIEPSTGAQRSQAGTGNAC